MTYAVDTTAVQQYRDDEINLIELLICLWQEKAIIVTAIIMATAIGGLYAWTRTPLYKASVQLTSPSSAELAYLNQTEHFSVTPDSIFSDFFKVMTSHHHIDQLVTENATLLEQTLGIKANENAINSILSVRKFVYPSSHKKEGSIEPGNYYLAYTGVNRNALKQLIIKDIQQAQSQLLDKTQQEYRVALQQKIDSLSRKQTLELKALDNQLISRKTYLLHFRKKLVQELEEALKIAQSLNIQLPKSVGQLTSPSPSRAKEENINIRPQQQTPLYLRGTKLLAAEIKNLKNTATDSFIDDEIMQLEAEKSLLANNIELEQLQDLLASFQPKQNLSLFSNIVNTPNTAISPNKPLIISLSALLGFIVGVLIAIAKVAYRNHKKTSAAE